MPPGSSYSSAAAPNDMAFEVLHLHRMASGMDDVSMGYYPSHFEPTFVILLNDGGRILNISSGLARFSMHGSAVYGAAKGAVEVLTRYQAVELAERRISVNVLAPGAIATDFSGGMVRDNPEVNRRVAGFTALGRVGLPDDIGAAAAALLAPDNGWINGQRIEASGGMML